MYLLPKIHKKQQDIPGRPVISNCGTATEKVSEFLDFHLKPVMQKGQSYIKDTGHFLDKLRSLGVDPDNAILVAADVVGLYPSIPHTDGLQFLHDKLEESEVKEVPSDDLVQMADFVLKNNYFEFDGKVYQQFMNKVEIVKPWLWPPSWIFRPLFLMRIARR